VKALMLDSSYGKTIDDDTVAGDLRQWWMFSAVSLPDGDTVDTFVEIVVQYDPRGPMYCGAEATVYDFDNGRPTNLFRLTEPPSGWWSEVNAKLVAATNSAPSRLATVADQLSNRMAVLLSKAFEGDTWARTDTDEDLGYETKNADEKQHTPEG